MACMGSDENLAALTKGIKSFLRSVGMDQYYERFIAKGFDLETDLPFLTTTDLDELNITVPEHRCVLLATASSHRVSEDFKVYQWLRDSGLDYYFVSFVRSELVQFDDIRNLDLPDEDLYEELEITLTGHKKRLERAVQKLRKRQRTSDDAEPAIMEGWWGKPVMLTEAKYDFLCVSATIGSTQRHSQCQTIDFMVDSGSDVTTLRQEVLETLDLELLGSVQSKGVHASRTKNLYKARLQIGTETLEIEVMGECYDSLGSRVFRHFRHYITGSKHVWLKGDYFDPSMIARPTTPCPESVQMSDSDDVAAEEEEMSEEVSDDCSLAVQTESRGLESGDVVSETSDVIHTSSQKHQNSVQQIPNSPLKHLETGCDANIESHNVAPCTVNDATCSVNDATCSVNDATCSVNDATCSVNDATCSVNGDTCSVNDATCSVNDATCSVNDACSVNGDTPCPANKTLLSSVSDTMCSVNDSDICSVGDSMCSVNNAICSVIDETSCSVNNENNCSPGDGPHIESDEHVTARTGGRENTERQTRSPSLLLVGQNNESETKSTSLGQNNESETGSPLLSLHGQNNESETRSMSLLVDEQKRESKSSSSLLESRDCESAHRRFHLTDCEILDESEDPPTSESRDSDNDSIDSDVSISSKT